MNIVNRLTENDFKELCGVLCPYCRAGLPDYDHGYRENSSFSARSFTHHIPGAEAIFPCNASVLRTERTVVPYRMPAE